LFAVLERIQEKAHPDINVTIRDRYYSAASGTPASVFPTLMRLKNHHLSKLKEDKGIVIYFERLLGEIVGEINDFQSQLNLQDQGRFAIGYYHQRQDFFTKQETLDQGE
jgi:CRISPR-associated protein Csd1